MKKWHVLIMEYLLELAIINMLLNFGSLELMYFNDLHLFVDNFHFTALQGYNFHS